MKKYTVKVKIVFEGEVHVTAKTRKLAGDIVKQNFRASLANVSYNFHEQIVDWKMPVNSIETLMIGNPWLFEKP